MLVDSVPLNPSSCTDIACWLRILLFLPKSSSIAIPFSPSSYNRNVLGVSSFLYIRLLPAHPIRPHMALSWGTDVGVFFALSVIASVARVPTADHVQFFAVPCNVLILEPIAAFRVESPQFLTTISLLSLHE